MRDVIYYVVMVFGIISLIGSAAKKNKNKNTKTTVNTMRPSAPQGYGGAMASKESSAMPHVHREAGVYDTANRRRRDNSTGSMPHKHNEARTKYIDVATLPKGYILLNGEPVRTKDLENY